jgi:hypothetical protein
MKAKFIVYDVPEDLIGCFMDTDRGELGTFMTGEVRIRKLVEKYFNDRGGYSADMRKEVLERYKKDFEEGLRIGRKETRKVKGVAKEFISCKDKLFIGDNYCSSGISIERHLIEEFRKEWAKFVKNFGADEAHLLYIKDGGHDQWANDYCRIAGPKTAVKKLLARIKKRAVKSLSVDSEDEE